VQRELRGERTDAVIAVGSELIIDKPARRLSSAATAMVEL